MTSPLNLLKDAFFQNDNGDAVSATYSLYLDYKNKPAYTFQVRESPGVVEQTLNNCNIPYWGMSPHEDGSIFSVKEYRSTQTLNALEVNGIPVLNHGTPRGLLGLLKELLW